MRRAAPVLLVALALAGCGAAAKQPPAIAKPPHLPRVLADTWATQANAVAEALAQTDGCTALRYANDLQGAVTQAIAARQVPARLQSTLIAAVDALPGRITCNPAPPQKHDHGKHKGHGNGGD
jgi:hypothetical protein